VPWLWVLVRYEFDCVEPCPERFALDTTQLLELEGDTVTPAPVEFVRESVIDYDPMLF